MTWLGLFYLTVAEWATRWGALAETQRAQEVRLRYLHSLVNPLARSTNRPWPQHLRQEDHAHRHSLG